MIGSPIYPPGRVREIFPEWVKDDGRFNVARFRSDFPEYRTNRSAITLVCLTVRDGVACHYCRVQLDPPYKSRAQLLRLYGNEVDEVLVDAQGVSGTVDHVVPRSAGGGDEWANLVAACARCNASKHNSDYVTYLARLIEQQ